MWRELMCNAVRSKLGGLGAMLAPSWKLLGSNSKVLGGHVGVKLGVQLALVFHVGNLNDCNSKSGQKITKQIKQSLTEARQNIDFSLVFMVFSCHRDI